MVYLIAQFWFWFIGALAIGCATALMTREEEQGGKIAPWLVWSLLAFGLGALAAFLHVLVGRAGVWLETALIAFASFLIGAALGVLARSGQFREHRGWALGLLPAAILWSASNIFETPKLETGLRRQVGEAVKNAGGDPKNLTVNGRDVLLSADAPNRDHLQRTIDNVAGVRLVAETNQNFAEIPAESAAPESIETVAGEESSRAKTEEAMGAAGGAAKGGTAAVAAGGSPRTATAALPANAASSPAERAQAAQRMLKALPESGPLDAAVCQSALDATLLLGRIQFTSNGGGVRAVAVPALNQTAALLQRCPEAKVEVGGHTDVAGNAEANRALSQRQADTVVHILSRMGVSAERLTAVGYGATKPIAAKNRSAENRRVEIILR